MDWNKKKYTKYTICPRYHESGEIKKWDLRYGISPNSSTFSSKKRISLGRFKMEQYTAPKLYGMCVWGLNQSILN